MVDNHEPMEAGYIVALVGRLYGLLYFVEPHFRNGYLYCPWILFNGLIYIDMFISRVIFTILIAHLPKCLVSILLMYNLNLQIVDFIQQSLSLLIIEVQ